MSERAVYPKSTCCVLGCPRWSRKFPVEWMCGRHWRMAPLRLRRAFNRAEQRLNDLQSRHDGGTWTPDMSQQWDRLCGLHERFWEHIRRRVFLQEAGL